MVGSKNSSKVDLSSQFQRSRCDLYDWIRKCLFGFGHEYGFESSQFDLQSKPLDIHHVGILFPIMPGISGTDPVSEEVPDDPVEFQESGDPETAEQESAKPASNKTRYIPPSSAGFSFFIRGDKIRLQITPRGVRYVRSNIRDSETGMFLPERWYRKPLQDSEVHLPDFIPPSKRVEHSERRYVFGDRAELFILWRPFENGWLTTISLSNCQHLQNDSHLFGFEYRKKLNELSIFETELECIVETGKVGNYPQVDPSLLSHEEQELELQYRNRRIYAVGHGAAVDWEEESGHVKIIRIEFLPKFEVPLVSVYHDNLNPDVLDLLYLSQNPHESAELRDELNAFINTYERWVLSQKSDAKCLPERDQNIAIRIVNRMKLAVERMRKSLHSLTKDQNVSFAFATANKAMLDQMKQHSQIAGKDDVKYHWRPFQLAFLLLVIESAVNEDSEFRDTLDLIWFPTGGGKTEAYLGLIAFLIVWRRLRYPTSGSGTTVLMRYTLRLLTKQQFQRATRLICALELLRRREPDKLGEEPISIGMWVGEASSPNTFHAAHKILSDSASGRKTSMQNLILESCPWCAKTFSKAENFVSSHTSFEFRCTNPECDFGLSQGVELPLPCNVVDEALYNEPPTLLIATIDKFARFAWEERATTFFGQNGNRPPELVIQDELHLITGALGSVAGLYEAALDTILAYRGIFPKYIASTATIRMAKQQGLRLYGREVAVFPPPGLTIDDSFFSRTVPVEERPGRLYVGYLAPLLNRQMSLGPLASSLLSAPEVLFKQHRNQDLLLDAWWTVVIYHGSLKSVGMSHNLLNIDVPEYWSRYLLETVRETQIGSIDEVNLVERESYNSDRLSKFMGRIAQLTSISSPEENAINFMRLERQYDDPDCLDVVLATNMISVGLDVSRLASMVVNGQPLTTAEYIQATSRVGRSSVPGIVITNYYRDQARSLSHYESFKSFHDSFYRYVEPSSVTPFTFQARQRALHAALVIVVRHCCKGMGGNSDAGRFNPDSSDVSKVIEMLILRCKRADQGHGTEIERHIRSLAEQWRMEAIRCKRDRRRLDYQAPDNNHATDRLLYSHNDRIPGLWNTLNSMRNVENSALLKLL